MVSLLIATVTGPKVRVEFLDENRSTIVTVSLHKAPDRFVHSVDFYVHFNTCFLQKVKKHGEIKPPLSYINMTEAGTPLFGNAVMA